MKKLILLVLMGVCFSLGGCGKKDPNAVEPAVDFSWDGYKHCGMGLPQLSIGGIPERTRFL